ncbi:MAG: alpha-N-acetylglucosaminidase C-terminal domain-containing protein [Clostridia bacterium]|nr:alpha-N-acetylglucosaminidase C-terminal domain-containing protein [Clostridia bacterium]
MIMRTKRILAMLLAVLTAASLLTVFPAFEASAEDNAEENIALNKPVTTNRNPRLASLITDGNPITAWTSDWVPLYAEIDLQANYALDRVVVKLPLKSTDARLYEFAFNVYASDDGENFERVGEMRTPGKAPESGYVFRIAQTKPYRYVRVMSTMSTCGSGASTAFSEIEVYGTLSDTPVTDKRTTVEFPSYDEWLLKNCGVDLSRIRDENGKYRIEDTYTEADTVKALEGLVTRILGAQYLSWFTFDVTAPSESGNDYYEISSEGAKILIKGNKGVSIAAGLNHYLKYFCKVNVSQESSQVRMPDAVVPVGETIRTETVLPVRYTYNYCTLSYTMPYYGYDEWQRELDYLMLSGINVILDTTATEALWVMYLQKFGYTLEEAKQFVCGYAWKAWWLMGNLEGYGGPVSNTWIVDTVEMARVNQRYLAVMGADPCLQAFTGTLPTNFASKAKSTLTALGYPDISPKMTSTGSWAGFTRPWALNTDYEGFDYLAKTFYEVQDYIYGRIGDYYAGDFLHEISSGFKLDAQFDKARMSRAVLDKVIEENDRGVWIIQSWWENPLPEVVEGWGDDREDHMLLLDLAAAKSPRWKNRTNYGGYEFGGSSWCYCILEDYGGRDGAHLNLKMLAKSLANAVKVAEHIKGIGLTSEGTERNPVVFDLFWELAWYPETDAKDWIRSYAERRFGTPDAADAWAGLLNNLYGTDTLDGTTVNYAIGNYPKFDYTGGYFYPNYSRDRLDAALNAFLDLYDRCKDYETYVYDAVELFTTELANTTTKLLEKAFNAAKAGDYDAFKTAKAGFLRAMQLADELNGYVKNQTLGNWVGRVDVFTNDARTGSYSDFDVDLMKLDAVILITNWSTIDLGNYAYRLFNGLIDSYYYTMWNTFMQSAEMRVKTGGKITKGDERLDATVTYCYNVGRQTALDAMFGKPFLADAVPVDGDLSHRSLKEVLTEISEYYFYTSKDLPFSATLREGSTLEIKDGTVGGAAGALTAGEIAAQFTVSGPAEVRITKDGRTLLDDGEKPEAGMKIVLYTEGSIFDVLGMTVGELKTDPAAAQQYAGLEAKYKALSDLWARVDKTRLGSASRAAMEDYISRADKALEGSSLTALTDLEKRYAQAEAILKELTAKNREAYVSEMPFDVLSCAVCAAAASEKRTAG